LTVKSLIFIIIVFTVHTYFDLTVVEFKHLSPAVAGEWGWAVRSSQRHRGERR